MCVVTGAGGSAESCLQFVNNFSASDPRSHEHYLGSSARKAGGPFLKSPESFSGSKSQWLSRNPLVLKSGSFNMFLM